jgi:hypothetical protein
MISWVHQIPWRPKNTGRTAGSVRWSTAPDPLGKDTGWSNFYVEDSNKTGNHNTLPAELKENQGTLQRVWQGGGCDRRRRRRKNPGNQGDMGPSFFE